MASCAFSQVAKKTAKYVLTGVDGNLGGIAAEYAIKIAKPTDHLVFTSYLLDKLPKDKVQRWRDAGVEVMEASYDKPEQLKKAFHGAEAVSFISTWLFGDPRREQVRNICKTAKESGVKRVCYTSFVGAGSTAKNELDIPFLPRDHHANEIIIRESGLQYSIQRDWLYQDNIATLFSQSWKFCGNKWINNTHGVPGAYVAREDCGQVQAALLLGKGKPNHVYDITGPEAITDLEVFLWMCEQTGYKAKFEDTPDEEMKKWWLDHGLPSSVYGGDFSKLPMKLCIGDLMCCGEMLANGSMRQASKDVEMLLGRPALGFRENLLKYKDIFPKPE
jgi:uncharacterized protein YbjT (DUF2867 family)